MMPARVRAVVLTILGLALAGCAANTKPFSPSTGSDTIIVKGALAYRERIALPPGSHADIAIIDTAVADRQADVIVRRDVDLSDRRLPAAFEFDVARADLAARGRYSLRATIRGPRGQLHWTTDRVHSVDTDQRINDFGLLILKQAQADDAPSPDSKSPLTGAEWLVEDIADTGLIDASHVTLNFDDDGRVYGNGGCNRYSGEYDVDGHQLRVSQIAATMMACAPALNHQERRFMDVLQSVRRFDIDATGKLILRTDSGKTIEAYPAR